MRSISSHPTASVEMPLRAKLGLLRSNLEARHDCFEMVRLVEDSGFGFLPEGDLLNQPTMDVVMTVGLRLCALEFSSEQLKLLAYMCLSGVLPESFPHAQWVSAVFRSFSTQEAAICTCVAEWEEVRRMLEQVCTANTTLVSIQGVTLCGNISVHVTSPSTVLISA